MIAIEPRQFRVSGFCSNLHNCNAEQVKTLANHNRFHSLYCCLSVDRAGCRQLPGSFGNWVKQPNVTVMLTWSVLMTSYKPHPLVGVVLDERYIAVLSRVRCIFQRKILASKALAVPHWSRNCYIVRCAPLKW
jgi:hypothetical protein